MIYVGCGPPPSHSMYMGTVYEKVSGRWPKVVEGMPFGSKMSSSMKLFLFHL